MLLKLPKLPGCVVSRLNGYRDPGVINMVRLCYPIAKTYIYPFDWPVGLVVRDPDC